MRRLILIPLAAVIVTAGCQRQQASQSAADLVRAGAPEACSHPDVQAALAARLPGDGAAYKAIFSDFDREQLRIRCEARVEGRSVGFTVAGDPSRAGGVTVTLDGPAEPAPADAAETPDVEAEGAPSPPAPGIADTPAIADAYTYDVPKLYPAAFALWGRQIRDLPLDNRPWARTLTGPAAPLKKVSVGGAEFILGWVCQPHNCGGNEAVLMISPDQTRVLGLVRLTESDQGAVDHPVGAPGALEARCLKFYMEDRSDARQCA